MSSRARSRAEARSAAALTQLCVCHVHCSLEMLIQRLSHLHGLSRWPYHFAALGLQPARVTAALDAAAALRASAELLLTSVRQAHAEISGLLWDDGAHVNRYWGYTTRAGFADKSHLMRQIEKYADIYTSRVSNLMHVTPYGYLRGPRGSLAHDAR